MQPVTGTLGYSLTGAAGYRDLMVQSEGPPGYRGLIVQSEGGHRKQAQRSLARLAEAEEHLASSVVGQIWHTAASGWEKFKHCGHALLNTSVAELSEGWESSSGEDRFQCAELFIWGVFTQ